MDERDRPIYYGIPGNRNPGLRAIDTSLFYIIFGLVFKTLSHR